MRQLVSAVTLALAMVMAADTPPQQKFPVVSVVDEPTIAARPVELDAQGKLLPWPMPDNTGYSYSSHVLSQWTILWDQYSRQRLPYYHCCFDIDRTTYELIPIRSGQTPQATFAPCFRDSSSAFIPTPAIREC